MPTRASRICCGQRIAFGQRCACQRVRAAEADRRRPTARQRGYTVEWQRESKAFLAQSENRFCACGCGRYADMVDHRIPHRGDHVLFWDRANWQALATHCHNTKKQSLERGTRGVSQTSPQGGGTGRDQPRDIFPNFSSSEKGQSR